MWLDAFPAGSRNRGDMSGPDWPLTEAPPRAARANRRVAGERFVFCDSGTSAPLMVSLSARPGEGDMDAMRARRYRLMKKLLGAAASGKFGGLTNLPVPHFAGKENTVFQERSWLKARTANHDGARS